MLSVRDHLHPIKLARLFALVFMPLAMIACGGGGGGGSGGGDGDDSDDDDQLDGQIYPKIPLDGREFGVPVSYENGQFTYTSIYGKSYNLTTQGKNGNHYRLNTVSAGDETLYATALMSSDVLLIGGVLANAQPDPTLGFGVSGNFYEERLSGNFFFTGDYVAMNPNGDVIGRWPMEIVLNTDNLAGSYGADLITGQDITILFSDYSADALIGTVSDPTHDYHNASFNFYGNNGETMAGGFSDGFGLGLLLATQ